jgi:hypothetical protein
MLDGQIQDQHTYGRSKDYEQSFFEPARIAARHETYHTRADGKTNPTTGIPSFSASRIVLRLTLRSWAARAL